MSTYSAIPQYVPSSTSIRKKRKKLSHDSNGHGDNVKSRGESLGRIDRPMADNVSGIKGESGFGGRFSIWTPDHVVLESLDGIKLSISKSALSHSSQLFKDMFELPTPADDIHTAIPTFVPTVDLYNLLLVIEDQSERKKLESTDAKGKRRQVPEVVAELSVKEKIVLEELAERFDCRVIDANVKRSLAQYYANFTGPNLLVDASRMDSVRPARVAITRLADDVYWTGARMKRQWWQFVKQLRPAWQVELAKLFWVPSQQLVDRPSDINSRTITGRKRPRTRETVWVWTDVDYKDIAAAFNPTPETK